MFTITDQDISFAEKALLPEGHTFDDERRTVIKCLESKDVIACPGSGKTTALLAKLIVLSRQFPVDGNKGICVLTHTNVAIDTIARGAGLPAAKLFEYPNHFGTIQSFVDKYLAIPAYVETFGRRPDKIDKDWYDAKIEQRKKLIGNKALSFCHKYEKYENYPNSICFSDFEVSAQNGCSSLHLDLNKAEDREIYTKLLFLKLHILDFGILSYDDAYHLASCYLDKHPAINSLFSKRFPYVFIDEMQDTDSKQVNLLGRLFDSSVVLQRIGDINQSIFNFNTENECCWAVSQNILEITGSKRFSNSIASAIKSVCIHPQNLRGNPEIPNIKPTIIAFTDDNIHKVIPRFGDLIFEHNLHTSPGGCFKAVGWIGKPHETKHTLPSYWDTYEKEIQTKNSEYTNLVSYIAPESDEFLRINGVRFYRTAIIRALIKCLRIVDKPSGMPLRSEAVLFKYIRQKDEKFCSCLELKLSEWCLAIHMKQSALEEISRFIRTQFGTFFDINNISLLDDFLGDRVVQARGCTGGARTNKYTHVRDTNRIDIEISTVHSVKGQTHTATLYLETFYHDYDVLRIIEYLKGNYRQPTQKLLQSNLRISYVGMSRPSRFLCVAVHNTHLANHSADLLSAGWDIDSNLCTGS
jgi:DNA helicase II / ATP-dependent DNA helicase PcrA